MQNTSLYAEHGGSFVRAQKIKPQSKLRQALIHNLRDFSLRPGCATNIDTARSHRNVILAGPHQAQAAMAVYKYRLSQARLKALRKDAIVAVELVISTPPGFAHAETFFPDALAWVERHYAVPILSAVVHHDEAVPHMHVLLIPLRNGRMQGSGVVGYKPQLLKTQLSFYQAVGAQYGFAPPRGSHTLSREERFRCAQVIRQRLRTEPALLDDPHVAEAVCYTLAQSPERVAAALEIPLVYVSRLPSRLQPLAA